MKQNNASRLCAVFFLYEMWAWCSVHVLAAPKAAQTLHDDLSVMVDEGDEKEENAATIKGIRKHFSKGVHQAFAFLLFVSV